MIITIMVCTAAPDGECLPGRTCTLECPASCRRLDIMVKPEQCIEKVCRHFIENGMRFVYSLRQEAYVNPSLTFWKGKIYAGDILVIGETDSFAIGKQ